MPGTQSAVVLQNPPYWQIFRAEGAADGVAATLLVGIAVDNGTVVTTEGAVDFGGAVGADGAAVEATVGGATYPKLYGLVSRV